MGGETRRADDHAARSRSPGLASAERQVKEIAAQYGWAAPGRIEIRVYPDVETFRNATGEPGWVAARTTGRRIEIQPAAPRDPTIRHELLHVFVESQANTALPVGSRRTDAAIWRGPRTALLQKSPRAICGRRKMPHARGGHIQRRRKDSRTGGALRSDNRFRLAENRPPARGSERQHHRCRHE